MALNLLGDIVTVGELGSSHYGTDDARFNQLYTYRHDHGVRLSIRRGVLRFSLHLYNTEDDSNASWR
ncbi:hypothetical protein [Candidatus Entotheonella palauensis]|uniref:hypothetical protein n=1 Tax=Candidatus Entotheonella palauensis TaxID=93172 RepID=UPI0015C4DEC0|nr:hypothetical protein [Candidatus Entotheonella palauensis]